MDSLIETVDPVFSNDIKMYENPVGEPQLVKQICDSEAAQITEMSANAKAMDIVQNPDLNKRVSYFNNNEISLKPEETSLRKTQFSCKSCDFFANSKVDIVVHFKEIHMDRTIEDRSKVLVLQCSSCSMTYSDERRLAVHKKVCKEIINKTKDDLQSQGSIDGETPAMLKCAQCDFKTRYGGKLKAHLYNKHPENTPWKNEVKNPDYVANTGNPESPGTVQDEVKYSRISPKASKKSSTKNKSPLTSMQQNWHCVGCKFSTKSEKILTNHVTKKHPELTKTPLVGVNDVCFKKSKRIKHCPCCAFKTSSVEKFSSHLIENHPIFIPILNKTSKILSRRMNLCYRCPLCPYKAINCARYSQHLAKYHVPEQTGKKHPRPLGKNDPENKGKPKKEKQKLPAEVPKKEFPDLPKAGHEAEVIMICSKCSHFTSTSLKDVALHYKTCSGAKETGEDKIKKEPIEDSNKLPSQLEQSEKSSPEERAKDEVNTKPNFVQCKKCSFTTTKLVLLAMHYKTCGTAME